MPKARQSQLRIIGGQWRSRRLSFLPEPGLRPTTDRVRETLFNWLAPRIAGSHCLDLFAGSGALGLEALSRGAAHCDFVDCSAKATRQISKHLLTLGEAERATCTTLAAETFINTSGRRYDIAFIDPPFDCGLVGPTCQLLRERGLMLPDALVYIEMGSQELLPELPREWQSRREKRTGGVVSRLLECP